VAAAQLRLLLVTEEACDASKLERGLSYGFASCYPSLAASVYLGPSTVTQTCTTLQLQEGSERVLSSIVALYTRLEGPPAAHALQNGLRLADIGVNGSRPCLCALDRPTLRLQLLQDVRPSCLCAQGLAECCEKASGVARSQPRQVPVWTTKRSTPLPLPAACGSPPAARWSARRVQSNAATVCAAAVAVPQALQQGRLRRPPELLRVAGSWTLAALDATQCGKRCRAASWSACTAKSAS